MLLGREAAVTSFSFSLDNALRTHRILTADKYYYQLLLLGKAGFASSEASGALGIFVIYLPTIVEDQKKTIKALCPKAFSNQIYMKTSKKRSYH